MNCSDVLIFHPTGGWGGAEKTTCNIARALSQGAIRVSVLTNEGRFRSELPQNVHTEIVPFHPWFDSGWKAIICDLMKLIQLYRRLKPKVVIGMMPYAAFLASVARRLLPGSFVHVASPRGSCLNYLKHFVSSPRDYFCYRFFF